MNVTSMTGPSVTLSRPTPWWLPVIGGLLFAGIFYLRYWFLPADLYAFRDDGVITLSHAKNWIDYGFIGVNPSGERVEAYSAPVQFFLYAALYALTGCSFATYIALQTWLSTFALGACFIAFFVGEYTYRLAATTFGAILLCAHTSFIEWHGSGMENALTHALFLGTMLVLYASIRSGKIHVWQAAIPFLASISRLESMYYIAPLLIVFCLYWHYVYKTPKALRFCGTALCGWIAFMAWRYCYFGSLNPNTAVAQGLDVLSRIAHWQDSMDEALGLAKTLLLRHGITAVLLLMPLLIFLPNTSSKPMLFLISLLLCTLFMVCFHPFFFGAARMDIARTTTHFALCAALASALLLFHPAMRTPAQIALPLLALIAWSGVHTGSFTPYKIGWGTSEFREYLHKFAIASAQEHIPRPMIANADLGMISWQKRFNIIDLGKIGSPIIATLASQGEIRGVADYIFEFAAPDIIESHSSWSCWNAFLYSDPRLRILYQPVYEKSDPKECDGKEKLTGMWIRKDILATSNSPERQLVNSLVANLSTERIAQELEKCETSDSNNCTYIARTAYRFLPEFRERGMTQELEAIFEHRKHTPKFNRYLITGADDATAYKAAIDEILQFRSRAIVTPDKGDE